MEFTAKTLPDLPFVHVVETNESELWLTHFCSQGVLKDRLGLIQLMSKMYQFLFRCIRERHKLSDEQTQIILVLRDGIVAFYPALHEFPNAHVGLIGHERNTSTDPPTTMVSFRRYEDPQRFETVIVVDPMVATGETLMQVMTELATMPSKVIVACLLTTREAALKVKDRVTAIYAFSLEKGLVNVAWITPGLRGTKDLGDVIFNTALDWKTSEDGESKCPRRS